MGRPPHFYVACGTIVALRKPRDPAGSWEEQTVARKIMKPLIAIASSLLLCSCADMYVTKSRVGGSGVAAPTDTKDFGSHVRMITANCGVGAYNPHAIYIRPFCVDTAKFTGDQAQTDGEMPIRKALAPVEFAEDLKEQLEKIAPARIQTRRNTPYRLAG